MESEGTVKKQDKRKTLPQLFKKGQSGNPNGRPAGSISIIGRIKQIWEQDPERFEQYIEGVIEDPKLRQELIHQLDGRAAQIIKGDSSAPFVVQLVSYGSNNPPQV